MPLIHTQTRNHPLQARLAAIINTLQKAARFLWAGSVHPASFSPFPSSLGWFAPLPLRDWLALVPVCGLACPHGVWPFVRPQEVPLGLLLDMLSSGRTRHLGSFSWLKENVDSTVLGGPSNYYEPLVLQAQYSGGHARDRLSSCPSFSYYSS